MTNLQTWFNLSSRNRVLTHMLIWVFYYSYRVMTYVEVYENTPIVQFLELFAKVAAVYINLYVLMPYVLRKKQYALYTFYLAITVVLASWLQAEVVRQMIYAEIYEMGIERLYTSRKIIGRILNITDIVFWFAILKILKDSYQSQQREQQLEQERLENELKFLKTQVNPHFFFNTLNNLYSLIISQSDLAAKTVLKLSDFMHYLLYETNHQVILLSKELEYLQDYISLEKLRFGDELNLEFEIKGSVKEQTLPPLLFLPLVENAFKHGIKDAQTQANILICLEVSEKAIFFRLENDLFENTHKMKKSGGIGLKNLRRRLSLLYGEEASFIEKMTRERYIAELTINL